MDETDEKIKTFNTFKNADSYWKEFEKSGSISAYLKYTQTRSL